MLPLIFFFFAKSTSHDLNNLWMSLCFHIELVERTGSFTIRPGLKLCWFVVTQPGLQDTCGTKFFFDHSQKIFFSHKCIILVMLTHKSKVNILFFFLHHFSVVSGCFDFSYPLSSVQFSLGRATLGCQTGGRLVLQQLKHK